jgi:hypothetical protein
MFGPFPYFSFLVPGLVPIGKGIVACVQAMKQSLISPDPEASGRYGTGCKIVGNELFIGETLARAGAIGFQIGVVQYYSRVDANSSFTFQSEFIPDSEASGGEFGTDVDYDGAKVIVGQVNTSNGGKAVVYDWSGSAWVLDEEFDGDSLISGARFGRSVAIEGVHVLVGAPSVPGAGSARGEVQYWENIAGTWTFRNRFIGDVDVDTGRFGMGLCMVDDSTAYILRNGDATGINQSDTSTVEKWTRVTTTWSYDSEWQVDFGTDDALFASMDTDGTNLIIGYSSFDDGGLSTDNYGLALVFNQSGAELARIVGTVSDSQLGTGVSIDGTEVVVGLPTDDHNSLTDPGTAEVWDVCL